MQKLEKTLDSREVAGMVKKDHSKLLRDIRTYIDHLAEAKIGFSDFFKDSQYKDCTGRTLPCYKITEKGCEFIAHKLNGAKGTEFTARYINRFHEMEDMLSDQRSEPEMPWFIRKFRGRYIMLFRDFESITGVQLLGNYTSWKRPYRLEGGMDYNGWGWKKDRDEFKQEYGFDYGTDNCMLYLYLCGIEKALKILKSESGIEMKAGAYESITKGISQIALLQKGSKPARQIEQAVPAVEDHKKETSVTVTIAVNKERAEFTVV